MKQFTIPLLCIILLSSTCEKENANCHKSILFVNESEIDVYILPNSNYPDTLNFMYDSSPEFDKVTYKIVANTASENPLNENSCWEAILSGNRIPSDTLMIYVFDAQIIENMDWEDVVYDYMVLKRYDLSMQDFEGMNWTITYP